MRDVVAPIVLLALFGVAAGLFDAGPVAAAALGPAAWGLLAATVGAGVGFALASLTLRDARVGWSLSSTGASATLGLVLVLAGFAMPPLALVAACPSAAAYIWRRGGSHASDAAFMGVCGIVAWGVARHAAAWDEASVVVWIVPVALVALALLAREAWDLRGLAASARASVLPSGAAGEVRTDAVALGAMARAVLVVALGVALAALLGALRAFVEPAARAVGPGIAAVLLVAGLVGLLRMLRPEKARVDKS